MFYVNRYVVDMKSRNKMMFKVSNQTKGYKEENINFTYSFVD